MTAVNKNGKIRNLGFPVIWEVPKFPEEIPQIPMLREISKN